MAHVYADRVADTTTTTGTSAFALANAEPTGYQNFDDVCGNGDTIHYCAQHRLLDQWEVGTGTYGAGTNVLTRTTILSSSNGGSAVNFSSGTKDIFGVLPASVLGNLQFPAFNVTEYGATGDGVTDDRAAIEAASLAASTTPRGRVFFPAGTYLVSSSLTGYSDVEFCGESNNTSIIKCSSGWTDSSTNPTIYFNSKSRGVVRDLGFSAASSKVSPQHILLSTAADCLIENCRFDANRGWSVLMILGSTGNKVVGIISEGTAGTTHNVEINGSAYNSVINCTLKSSGGNGIELYDNTVGASISTRGNRLIGNYISAPASAGILLQGTAQTTVVGNTIKSSANAGIYLAESALTPGQYPLQDTIVGNTIYTTTADSGITVIKGTYCTIEGNTIRSAFVSGISMAGTYCAIKGNTIVSCTEHGILLNGGNNTVIGNVCADNSSGSSHNSHDGIIVNADNNILIGNRCYDNRYGILILAGADNNTVLGNELTGNNTGTYVDSGASNTLLTPTAISLPGGAVTAKNFVPSGTDVPTNGMYLPASNILGFAINSLPEMALTAAELEPAFSDGLALGSTSLMWSDLFLASGAVVNFNAGNYTLIHSAGALAASGTFSATGISGTLTLAARSGTGTPAAASAVAGVSMGSALVGLYWGTGDPNGQLTAPRGSIYTRTDGGTNTSLWLNSDSSTTWKAVTSA